MLFNFNCLSISEYKARDLYNILSGTYESTDPTRTVTSADLDRVKSILNLSKNEAGRFALNPANNPEFKVVGRASLTKDGSDLPF